MPTDFGWESWYYLALTLRRLFIYTSTPPNGEVLFLCNEKTPATQAEGLHGGKCDCKADRPCTTSITSEFIKPVKHLYRICTGLKRQQKRALRYLELIGSLPTSSFFYTISIFERAKRTLHFLLVHCPDQRIENRGARMSMVRTKIVRFCRMRMVVT